MTDDEKRGSEVEVVFIDAPRDPDLQALHAYWDSLRRGRTMPLRADFDPTKVPKLLRYIVLYTVDGASRYATRLVGDAIQEFAPHYVAGKALGSILSEHSAAIMTQVLDAVVAERAPKYRRGKTHWLKDLTHREFEACFLPLSRDGSEVNIIVGGIKVSP
jgi:hypothetical protein